MFWHSGFRQNTAMSFFWNRLALGWYRPPSILHHFSTLFTSILPQEFWSWPLSWNHHVCFSNLISESLESNFGKSNKHLCHLRPLNIRKKTMLVHQLPTYLPLQLCCPWEHNPQNMPTFGTMAQSLVHQWPVFTGHHILWPGKRSYGRNYSRPPCSNHQKRYPTVLLGYRYIIRWYFPHHFQVSNFYVLNFGLLWCCFWPAVDSLYLPASKKVGPPSWVNLGHFPIFFRDIFLLKWEIFPPWWEDHPNYHLVRHSYGSHGP